MKNKWNKEDELEYKIDEINLLSKVREKMIKELHLKINIDNINTKLVENLNEKFKNLKNGNCHLKVTILSNNNGKNISLDMISREKKFELDDNLLNLLSSNPEIDYIVNK